VGGSTSNRRNARILKALSLLYLGLAAFSLLLVHRPSYEPGVSFVLLYLSAAVVITAAIALLFLSAEHFTGGFCAAAYVFFAAFVSLEVFFSGGVSSELHALYWPLILAAALHGSWRIGLASLLSVLAGYVLAMLPAISDGGVDAEDPALMFFRLGAFTLTGLFTIFAARSLTRAGATEEGYVVDEDGSIFLEMVADEMDTRQGERWRQFLWILAMRSRTLRRSWIGCALASGSPCFSGKARSSGLSSLEMMSGLLGPRSTPTTPALLKNCWRRREGRWRQPSRSSPRTPWYSPEGMHQAAKDALGQPVELAVSFG